MQDAMTLVDVMKVLRVSRLTVRELLARGDLKGFQRGHIVRINRHSVDHLLAGAEEIWTSRASAQ